MSQKKKLQPLFGIHHAVVDEVQDFCRDKGITLWGHEFRLLVAIADSPGTLLNPVAGKKQTEDFCRLLAHRPDDVLALLTFIRDLLAEQQATPTGKTRHFLLKNSIVRMKDSSGHGTLRQVHDLKAEDIARLLFPGRAASLKGVVTQERKNLRRRLERKVVSEDPDMIHYMKTGIASKRVKKLLGSKGMK